MTVFTTIPIWAFFPQSNKVTLLNKKHHYLVLMDYNYSFLGVPHLICFFYSNKNHWKHKHQNPLFVFDIYIYTYIKNQYSSYYCFLIWMNESSSISFSHMLSLIVETMFVLLRFLQIICISQIVLPFRGRDNIWFSFSTIIIIAQLLLSISLNQWWPLHNKQMILKKDLTLLKEILTLLKRFRNGF